MRPERSARPAFAIFITTVCEGTIPAWCHDDGIYVTYATERDAQVEIIDDLKERIRQFMAGEREFEDAIAVEEFILPVDVWPDGSISTEDGSVFSKRS